MDESPNGPAPKVARGAGAAFWFSRVRLRNWRNFREAETALSRRTFLIGPNASGKSNFLDAFRFLRDLALPGGGLHRAVERRGGVSRLRCLSSRQDPRIGLEVELSSGERVAWRYELVFHQDSQKRPTVKRERVWREGELLLSRPDSQDDEDTERLSQTHLEQINVNRPFRELAEALREVRYLHIVPQLIREPARSAGRKDDPYGGDFLEHLAQIPERTRIARLRKVNKALGFAIPQLEELKLERDAKGTPHLKGRYRHWRGQGAWQTEEELSDETLRLLGLLWAVLDGSGPLLLEEPELSLHPEVVRLLPQLFTRIQTRGKRQILVSSHSAELLHDTGIGLDEVVLLEPGEEGTRLGGADSIPFVRQLLDGGSRMSEIVLKRTRPADVEQLLLFPE